MSHRHYSRKHYYYRSTEPETAKDKFFMVLVFVLLASEIAFVIFACIHNKAEYAFMSVFAFGFLAALLKMIFYGD